MSTHTLTIPKWRPPLVNQWRGRHWRVAHSLRKDMTGLIVTMALAQRVPGALGPRRVSVTVRLAPRAQIPDADSFDKLFLDALVNAGLLTDDSAAGLVGRVEVAFLRGTAAEWGTTIQLTDVEGTP